VGTDFSLIGKALANPARSAMVGLLLEGRAYTATELGRVAGVSPSTASGHLLDLTTAGLVEVAAEGRYRYYKLASDDIASALEALARICPACEVRSLNQSLEAQRLALARTCYDHLAGRVAVSIFDSLLSDGWLLLANEDLAVTQVGEKAFANLGIDVAGCRAGRRAFARPCLDWTERRPHLAGALGAAMTSAMLRAGWWRRPDTGRGLTVTDYGRSMLEAAFGLDVEQLLATPPDSSTRRRAG
jgi:DNA-binding transcriptional ArsR family regulator